MIQSKHLSKKYSNRQVLDDVSFEIKDGEMIAVLGQSGAGKSTLLNIIGTLETPDAGEVNIDGVSIHQMKAKELARFRNQQLGFIFQFHYLLPEFTAIENVCMPQWIAQGKTDKQVNEQARYLLRQLGVEYIASAKPNQLSGGEQQRVAIARALINSPKYLLADEPTGNLDTASSLQFMELILRLKKENTFTFVMVTHNEALASQFDKKISIVDGKLQTNHSA